MCTKSKSFWSFPWQWIWLTWLLAFHIPWDCSNSTFHYPFENLYKELYGTLKAYERIKSKETIVHCCQNLCLSLHPFVPWSTFVFFPSFPFACELTIERWRIEVVEAQVEDSIFLVPKSADRVCHCCISVLLIEIYFLDQYIYILNMNI